jgi:hypothetical protein
MRDVPAPLEPRPGAPATRFSGRRLAVAVVTRARPGATPWNDLAWKVDSLLVGAHLAGARGTADPDRPTPLPASAGEQALLWSGLALELFPDQGESYYFNLLAPEPKVFVICSADPRYGLRPELPTLSCDEAMSHIEGDEDVQSVSMPAEIVRWLEAFVLEHYVPERKRKRERVPWSAADAAREAADGKR